MYVYITPFGRRVSKFLLEFQNARAHTTSVDKPLFILVRKLKVLSRAISRELSGTHIVNVLMMSLEMTPFFSFDANAPSICICHSPRGGCICTVTVFQLNHFHVIVDVILQGRGVIALQPFFSCIIPFHVVVVHVIPVVEQLSIARGVRVVAVAVAVFYFVINIIHVPCDRFTAPA